MWLLFFVFLRYEVFLDLLRLLRLLLWFLDEKYLGILAGQAIHVDKADSDGIAFIVELEIRFGVFKTDGLCAGIV